jgi:hypothetical protein
MKHLNIIQSGISRLLALLAFAVSATPLIGAYNSITSQSRSDLITQNAENDEELWAKSVACSDSSCYMTQPFADGMTGDVTEDGGDYDKAVLHVTDTSKVHGNTVNIPLYGGYGGGGVQGSSTRVGKEEKSKMTTMQLVIGRQFYAVSDTNIAKSESLLGSNYDERVRRGLQYLHGRKRNDDILRRLIKRSSGRNLVFPVGSSTLTRATLKSANTLDTSVLTRLPHKLAGNGAKPMSLGGTNSGGGRVRNYMLMASQYALSDIQLDPVYSDALRDGDSRGDDNAIFRGKFKQWNGLGIYNWIHESHGNDGPQGSFMAPYGYLVGTSTTQADAFGGTLDAVTNSSYIALGSRQGLDGVGGSAITNGAAPADGTPAYTQYFSNAPWTYHNGLTESADTTTDRYIMIIDAAGGGYGVFKYRINNGNRILLHSAGAVVSIGVGTEITTFTAGSLVVECNALGAPFGRSLGFGAQMVVTGMGRIDGSSTSVGKRTREVQEYESVIGHGFENSWGCEVVERVDGTYPGFVMIEHAITYDGAPTIS